MVLPLKHRHDPTDGPHSSSFAGRQAVPSARTRRRRRPRRPPRSGPRPPPRGRPSARAARGCVMRCARSPSFVSSSRPVVSLSSLPDRKIALPATARAGADPAPSSAALLRRGEDAGRLVQHQAARRHAGERPPVRADHVARRVELLLRRRGTAPFTVTRPARISSFASLRRKGRCR
jgi:hypothetical protein